jgi:NTE family protein
MIAGSSMGALIGALYAIEPNAKKIEKLSFKLKDQKLFDYTFPRHGLIKGKKIEEILKENIGDINFKDLKIPLYITAYDLGNNREIIFSKGSVFQAVRASISIPGIFIPVINKEKVLVDGGVADPIPTEILRQMGADIIIAVNVNYMKNKKPVINAEAIQKQSKKSLPSIYESVMKSLHIRECEISEADLLGEKADVVINIDLEKIDGFDFTQSKKLINKGRYYARRYLKKIQIASSHPFKEFLEGLKEDLGVNKIVKEIKEVSKELTKELALPAPTPEVNKEPIKETTTEPIKDSSVTTPQVIETKKED